MSYRILLIGGGSGGHIFPLVAVGKALQEQALAAGKEIKLIMLGEGRFFKEAAQREAAQTVGFQYHSIVAGKIRRYFAPESFTDFLKMPIGLLQSLWYLFWIMPDAVFSKSGYASFFPVLAARFYRVPVYLHDSDAVPGMTSRLLSYFAKKIFIAFESAYQFFPAKRTFMVGNPVRESIGQSMREEAVPFFKLSPNLPTVFISGGSQGARNINNLVLQSLVVLTNNFQVIHQCGRENLAEVDAAAKQLIKEGENKYGEQISARYRLYPFLSDREISLAYTLADVLVGRAGAGSLFEMASVGKPSLIIPKKDSANDHQYYNALDFARYGGIVLQEDNLVPGIFVNQITEAYNRREELGQSLRNFAKPEAAENIAREILAGI